MGSSATALKTNRDNMKLLVVLSLTSVALGGMDYEMVQKWQKLKAMESCWGEENMKLVMVDMKKAIAKCSHEDAPELSLPPYRSSYRFVNTMINKGDNYENINDMATMFAKMMHEMKNRNSNYQVNSYFRHGDNKMDKMRMMMKMMKMSNMMNDHSSSSYRSDDDDMYDMFSEMLDSSSDRMDNYRSSDYSNQMGRMSHFKNMFNNMRYKRAAGDNLDLGDRLVEKLAEQKHHVEAKIGNMTCVMRELNVLDASNNIDVQAMKRDIQKYTMPSEWFKNKYEHLLDTCYEMATNLPADIADNSVVTGDYLRHRQARRGQDVHKVLREGQDQALHAPGHQEQGLVQLWSNGGHPAGDPAHRARVLPTCHAAAARQGDGLHDRWHVSRFSALERPSLGPACSGASCRRLQLPTVFHASNN